MVKTIDANQRGKIRAILFTALLGTGMLVCGICDLAIAGRLTWSLIVWSSILAAWVVGIFVVQSGKKGIRTALIAFSIVLAPFLYVLSCLIKVREVFRMGRFWPSWGSFSCGAPIFCLHGFRKGRSWRQEACACRRCCWLFW